MASASSVEELNREKRHSGNSVSQTLLYKVRRFNSPPRAPDPEGDCTWTRVKESEG